MAPALDNSSNVTSLPMIVEFLYTSDAGPSGGGKGSAVCPHCGADGRYVHYFKCDDGSTRGAMSGCIKLFPVSIVAQEHMRIVERLGELRKQYGPDAKLNSWQAKMLEAIESHYAGTITKEDAISVIKREKAEMAAYRQRKYGKRRW